MVAYIPYILPFILSALIIVGLIIFGWRQQPQPITRLFIWTLLSMFIWVAFVIWEYLSLTLAAKLIWANAQFLGITLLPVFWLLLTIEYTNAGDSWVRIKPYLFIVPLLSNIILWTNDWHHWWRGVSFMKTSISPIPLVDYDYQFWFYGILAPHGYILIAISLYLLFKSLRNSTGIYRQQIILLIVATILPLVSDGLYTVGVLFDPNFNPTPIVFTFSGILLAAGLFRYRLLDLMPVARDKLIEKMSDAMLVLDVQDRIVDLNPSMQNLLRVTADEAIGQAVDNVLQDWQPQVAPVRQAMQARREVIFSRDGRQSHFDLLISPLTDQRNLINGRLVVLRDITDRVLIENELRERNKELETFAHMVAHDLKSPLGIILGFSELLPAKIAALSNPETIEYIDIIHQTGQKMSDIIDALLLFARVRNQIVKVQQLDMNLILAEVMTRLHHMIVEKGAVVEQPDTWPSVVGYDPWIEEVWVNYIINGLKYGGQPPRLELGFDKQSGGMVCFWVKDNGRGISAENQPRLFTEFTRLEKGQAEGHGLGLSIVKRIVTRLGGTVGVDSELGQGSRFYFCLPVSGK
jgi:PAS domain S-box-containing protein